MAYQLGLPILLLREQGVMSDGLLERGIVSTYLPEFSLDGDTEEYLDSPEWAQIVSKWEGQVRSVVESKGSPPKLF